MSKFDDVIPKNKPTTAGKVAPTLGGPVRAGSGAGTVHLRGTEVGLDSEPGKTFIMECAQNVEGLRSDQDIKQAWGLDDGQWDALAENSALLNAIKTERERRTRNGEAAQEAAQRHFAKAPSILNEILQNETISPRHRIEAAKELRQVAVGARENAASGERFTIVIDLGEDYQLTKEFDQPARIVDHDGEAR